MASTNAAILIAGDAPSIRLSLSQQVFKKSASNFRD